MKPSTQRGQKSVTYLLPEDCTSASLITVSQKSDVPGIVKVTRTTSRQKTSAGHVSILKAISAQRNVQVAQTKTESESATTELTYPRSAENVVDSQNAKQSTGSVVVQTIADQRRIRQIGTLHSDALINDTTHVLDLHVDMTKQNTDSGKVYSKAQNSKDTELFDGGSSVLEGSKQVTNAVTMKNVQKASANITEEPIESPISPVRRSGRQVKRKLTKTESIELGDVLPIAKATGKSPKAPGKPALLSSPAIDVAGPSPANHNRKAPVTFVVKTPTAPGGRVTLQTPVMKPSTQRGQKSITSLLPEDCTSASLITVSQKSDVPGIVKVTRTTSRQKTSAGHVSILKAISAQRNVQVAQTKTESESATTELTYPRSAENVVDSQNAKQSTGSVVVQTIADQRRIRQIGTLHSDALINDTTHVLDLHVDMTKQNTDSGKVYSKAQNSKDTELFDGGSSVLEGSKQVTNAVTMKNVVTEQLPATISESSPKKLGGIVVRVSPRKHSTKEVSGEKPADQIFKEAPSKANIIMGERVVNLNSPPQSPRHSARIRALNGGNPPEVGEKGNIQLAPPVKTPDNGSSFETQQVSVQQNAPVTSSSAEGVPDRVTATEVVSDATVFQQPQSRQSETHEARPRRKRVASELLQAAEIAHGLLDNQDLPVTGPLTESTLPAVAPVSHTSPPNISTSDVSSSAVSSSAVSSSAVSTSAVSTSAISTSAVSTSAVSTSAVSTSAVSTSAVSTSDVPPQNPPVHEVAPTKNTAPEEAPSTSAGVKKDDISDNITSADSSNHLSLLEASKQKVATEKQEDQIFEGVTAIVKASFIADERVKEFILNVLPSLCGISAVVSPSSHFLLHGSWLSVIRARKMLDQYVTARETESPLFEKVLQKEKRPMPASSNPATVSDIRPVIAEDNGTAKEDFSVQITNGDKEESTSKEAVSEEAEEVVVMAPDYPKAVASNVQVETENSIGTSTSDDFVEDGSLPAEDEYEEPAATNADANVGRIQGLDRTKMLGSVEVYKDSERGSLFLCSMCGFAGNDQKSVQGHINRKHREKEFICKFCSKAFTYKREMERHMNIIHVQETKYICELCLKEFSDKRYLSTHIKRHSGIKNHMCNICGQKFFERHKLKWHLENHKSAADKNLPYECSICHKKFYNRSNLADHQNIHTGARPYECTQCDASFSHRIGLKRHYLVHTDEKMFPCEDCGKAFKTLKRFEMHQIQHTGVSKHMFEGCYKVFSRQFSPETHDCL